MVRFQLQFSPKAELDFASLEPKLRQRVVDKLGMFLNNEIPTENLEGNFQNFYKLRVGDYRIVYELTETSVMRVRLIGHRSRVYKDLKRLLDS